MVLSSILSWTPEFLVLLGTLLAVIYVYFKYKFGHWKRKGVPYLEPSFPAGNVGPAMALRDSFADHLMTLYKESEGKKLVGFYMLYKPALLIRDPDLLRTILVKDFNYFMDRGFYSNEEQDFTLGNLFFLPGNKWKSLRAKLSPTFTSGKMRMMFNQIASHGKVLADVIKDGEVTELRELVARYGTDVIASCAFGVDADSQHNPEAPFRTWGRRIFEPTVRTFATQSLAFLAPKIREVLGSLGMPFIPRDIRAYFSKVIRDTVEYREKNGVTRNDFLQLLIQLRNQGYVEEDSFFSKTENGTIANGKAAKGATGTHKKLTMDEMTAQALVFFLAGFETSSTTESFGMYQMALHPEVQDKLRAEVDAMFKETGGELIYDVIMTKLPYMDKVIAETLRMYPPVPLLNREVTKDYNLPGYDCVLEKGTAVVVPLLGLHNDPQYFPEPDRFDPERFSEANKAKLHPYVYLPFGDGPRICIGMRFAQMQIKACLSHILSNYILEPCEQTPKTIKMSPFNLAYQPVGGLYIRMRKRTDKVV